MAATTVAHQLLPSSGRRAGQTRVENYSNPGETEFREKLADRSAVGFSDVQRGTSCAPPNPVRSRRRESPGGRGGSVSRTSSPRRSSRSTMPVTLVCRSRASGPTDWRRDVGRDRHRRFPPHRARHRAADGCAGHIGRRQLRSNRSAAEQVAATIAGSGGQALVAQAEVADPDGPRRLFDVAEQRFGGVDVF